MNLKPRRSDMRDIDQHGTTTSANRWAKTNDSVRGRARAAMLVACKIFRDNNLLLLGVIGMI